ncbi:hypothetical protein ACJJTC_017358 [Scirpophaga incertulas]
MIALTPSYEIAKISAKLFDNPTTGSLITHRHVEACLAAAAALGGGRCGAWCWGVCLGRAAGALCRVALAPAVRAPPADHAAALPLSHRLALKLEGVLLPPARSKHQPKRQVKGVQITVTATPHPRTNEKSVELGSTPPALTAVQTVTPVRDFFSAQQLVSVSAAGLYAVAVEAAFVDHAGRLWHTGPRTSIVIKVRPAPPRPALPRPALPFSAQQLVSVSAAGLYAVAVEAAFVDHAGRLWHTGPRTSIVIKVRPAPPRPAPPRPAPPCPAILGAAAGERERRRPVRRGRGGRLRGPRRPPLAHRPAHLHRHQGTRRAKRQKHRAIDSKPLLRVGDWCTSRRKILF